MAALSQDVKSHPHLLRTRDVSWPQIETSKSFVYLEGGAVSLFQSPPLPPPPPPKTPPKPQRGTPLTVNIGVGNRQVAVLPPATMWQPCPL